MRSPCLSLWIWAIALTVRQKRLRNLLVRAERLAERLRQVVNCFFA